jgi:hypothetical protein
MNDTPFPLLIVGGSGYRSLRWEELREKMEPVVRITPQNWEEGRLYEVFSGNLFGARYSLWMETLEELPEKGREEFLSLLPSLLQERIPLVLAGEKEDWYKEVLRDFFSSFRLDREEESFSFPEFVPQVFFDYLREYLPQDPLRRKREMEKLYLASYPGKVREEDLSVLVAEVRKEAFSLGRDFLRKDLSSLFEKLSLYPSRSDLLELVGSLAYLLRSSLKEAVQKREGGRANRLARILDLLIEVDRLLKGVSIPPDLLMERFFLSGTLLLEEGGKRG